MYLKQNPGSSDSVVTKPQTGQRRNYWIFEKMSDLFLLQSIVSVSAAHAASYSIDTADSSSGRYEPAANIGNESIYTSAPAHFFMVCTGKNLSRTMMMSKSQVSLLRTGSKSSETHTSVI